MLHSLYIMVSISYHLVLFMGFTGKSILVPGCSWEIIMGKSYRYGQMGDMSWNIHGILAEHLGYSWDIYLLKKNKKNGTSP